MNTTSYWSDSAKFPRFARLDRDREADVVVIGAGITGITTAYLLKHAGYSVALIERGRCGGFDSVNTTAHLTAVTDKPLPEMVNHFGKEKARLTWEAGVAAIEQIAATISQERISCGFERVPGYRHLAAHSDSDGHRALQEEALLAEELGFPVEFEDSIPGLALPGVRFEDQAKFHPTKYLAALVKTIPGKGSQVYEHTDASEVTTDPLAVHAGKTRIRCQFVVVATHNPLAGKTNAAAAALFQTKLFLYTTYAVGARVSPGSLPEASYWDTNDPYHYLRIDRHRDHDYAILGGEDHKTGQKKNTSMAYNRLEKRLGALFKGSKTDHRWSGQVIETADGLPYIGLAAEGQFVATGFSGNGMTFGSLAARMAVDSLQQRSNPWAELFDVHRKVVHGGALQYLKENTDYPVYLVKEWMKGGEGASLRSLKRNQGKILRLRGQRVAAFRDTHGKVSLRSPICTHLKCIVRWNGAEKTWDCPCHGSRFAATGEVLSGPAESPLEPLPAPAARQR